MPKKDYTVDDHDVMNYELAIPRMMVEDLTRAAELRGQTFNDIIIKVLADSDRWQVKGCKAGNCTLSPEMEAGGRMGYCSRHYEEQYPRTAAVAARASKAADELLSQLEDEWRDK